jgi:hypothetical protein
MLIKFLFPNWSWIEKDPKKLLYTNGKRLSATNLSKEDINELAAI